LYRSGYFETLWSQIERPLLRRELIRAHEAGARNALDFACGTGRITELNEEIFENSTGVDVSGEMLGIAKQRCTATTFLKADLTLDKGVYIEPQDVLTAFRFLLNAEDSLRDQALQTWRSILRPGGTVLANAHWNSTSPAGVAYRVRNRLRRMDSPRTIGVSEFVKLFERHGYVVQQVIRYGLWPRIFPTFGGGQLKLMVASERLMNRVPQLAFASQNIMLVAQLGP
jgi:SAM-dependent methyltransferase